MPEDRNRFATAVLNAADRVRAAVDGWDVLLLASWCLLFIGLGMTYDIGVACMVMGALGLVGAIVGASGEELAKLIEAKKKGG